MPKFTPGDRVRSLIIEKLRGVVTEVDCRLIRVLWYGETFAVWRLADNWEFDPAAAIGSAEWLEQRAYAAAFARE